MAEIKISDEAFLAILRENGGLYGRTAQAIREQFGIEYSRQAVRQRALDHKEEYEDICEEVSDSAEDGLQTLMKNEDPRIKLDAIKFYLNSKAKNRGYTQRTELTGADGKPVQTETHVKIIRDKTSGTSPVDTSLQPTTDTGSEETV